MGSNNDRGTKIITESDIGYVYVNILTGEKFSSIYLANIDLINWSVRIGDGGGEGCGISLF